MPLKERTKCFWSSRYEDWGICDQVLLTGYWILDKSVQFNASRFLFRTFGNAAGEVKGFIRHSVLKCTHWAGHHTFWISFDFKCGFWSSYEILRFINNRSLIPTWRMITSKRRNIIIVSETTYFSVLFKLFFSLLHPLEIGFNQMLIRIWKPFNKIIPWNVCGFCFSLPFS